MKASATHIDRAALRIRAQLITTRNAMANQLRGLLKLFGLRMGMARTSGRRAERLVAIYRQRSDLEPLFAPLVASMEVIEAQLRADERPRRRADYSANLRRQYRGSPSLHQERGRWGLCRPCPPSKSVGGTGYAR
jgi:hypothetical protein